MSVGDRVPELIVPVDAACPCLGAGRLYRAFKTWGEWSVALLLLLLVTPLLGVLAVLIKLTSEGPAIYVQVRLGRFGQPYRMYKLRTMVHDCEARTGAVWAMKDDPRVTRLGRLLRASHLDELPQLWNVLRGEMSLIGPRPERPEIAAELETLLPGYGGRLLVRPGITGLAQVRLPADTDVEGVSRKLAYDLHYVRHTSLGLDLRIAASTAFHFLGAAATGMSKLLVEPFAPSPTSEPYQQPVGPHALIWRTANRANRGGEAGIAADVAQLRAAA